MKFLKKLLRELFLSRIESNYGAVFYFALPEQRKFIDLVRSIRKDRNLLLSDLEAYQLYSTAKTLRGFAGDVAEVGAFEGASTKIILEAVSGTDKKVYAFDTFVGLPANDIYHEGIKKGDYSASFERFKEHLKEYKNLIVKKGIFPETAKDLESDSFCFVHLDTDLYQSTKDALEFFYPRLCRGGTIISHDYAKHVGLRKAFEDYFKSEVPVFEITGTTQGMVVKI